MPKHVKLVPSEIARRPGSTSPSPVTLHGLSPDHAMIRVSARKPWRCTKYFAIGPTTAVDAASGGSLSASPGAVAASAPGCHARFAMSIRFIPAPSPWSIGAMRPASTEHMNELTSAMWRVAA